MSAIVPPGTRESEAEGAKLEVAPPEGQSAGSARGNSPDDMWRWNGKEWVPRQTMGAGFPQAPVAAPTPAYAAVGQPQRGQGMAVTSLVLGILSPILSFIPVIGLLFVPIPIVGLILGVLGLRSPGHGMAVAGVTLSAVGLAADVVWILVVVIGASLGG